MNRKVKATLLVLCGAAVHVAVFFVFSSSLRYSEKVWGGAAEGYAVAGLGVLMSAVLWGLACYTAHTLVRSGNGGLVKKLLGAQGFLWILFMIVYTTLVYAMCAADMEGNATLEQLKLNMTILVDGILCTVLTRYAAKM